MVGAVSAYLCRHGKALDDCTLCKYDLPVHMRDLSRPGMRAAAERYLTVRFASVKKFGGGKRNV